MTAFQVFFGRPDQPPRRLRNLLEERVDMVPPGGEILWVTYYFRDEALAEALIRAKRRGASVRVVVEALPRTQAANRVVQNKLQAAGALGPGYRALTHYLPNNLKGKRPHLHEKLYYFSHPMPVAFVGSFNPSGNEPEDPNLIAEIGDQDRGHNALVEIQDPVLVDGLLQHAKWILKSNHSLLERWLPPLNRELHSHTTRIYFFPRRYTQVIPGILESLQPGASVRVATSHLKDPRLLETFLRLAQRGVDLQILAHDTWRRVPPQVETTLANGNVSFTRYIHQEGLPMHHKFILIDDDVGTRVLWGSLNLTITSRYANHEILVISEDHALYQAFAECWERMHTARTVPSHHGPSAH